MLKTTALWRVARGTAPTGTQERIAMSQSGQIRPMTGLSWRHLSFPGAVVLLSVFAILGCDPEGPGAEGIVSLDGTIDSTTFVTLEVRAFPDDDPAFDITTAPVISERATGRYPLTEVTFPFEYFAGSGIGTTTVPAWRVVAWLSTELQPDWVSSGDAYGTATFSIAECPGFGGSYCVVTPGINLTIDTVAP